MADLPDGYYHVHHIASGCGDSVRVLVKNGRIVWHPARCQCGNWIHGPEDLTLEGAEADE